MQENKLKYLNVIEDLDKERSKGKAVNDLKKTSIKAPDNSLVKPPENNYLKDIPRGTAAYPDAKLYEKSNSRRNTESGGMSVNSETLANGKRKDTYNIGGNTISRNLSPEEASSGERKRFNLGNMSNQMSGRRQNLSEIPNNIRSDGTYSLKNGLDVNFDDSVSQNQRQAFMKDPLKTTNRLVHRGLAKNDPVNQPRSLESLPMSPKNKRKLDLEEARNNQTNQTNTRANEINSDRNRILEENNIMDDEISRLPKAVAPVKNDVRVIDVPDGQGGTMQKIMRDDGSGTYMDAMGTQEQPKILPDGHPMLTLLKSDPTNPILRRQFQGTYHYLPDWAK